MEAAVPATDTARSKAKTRRALLAGLRNGNLEKAVDKMEADTAGAEAPRKVRTAGHCVLVLTCTGS